jgi:hypothetical protein
MKLTAHALLGALGSAAAYVAAHISISRWLGLAEKAVQTVEENPVNFFKAIGEGFVWVGKELTKAVNWIPKVVTLVDDVEADTSTILPELAAVVDDAGEVAKAAIADSGSAIADAEALVQAIAAAAADKALNIAEDEAVVAAFKTFITQVTTKTNFSDVLTAAQKLVVDYDKLGASAKAALAKLESDASAS